MFHNEFYPTPLFVIEMMLNGVDVENKICYEPSAGKGDIITELYNKGAQKVYYSEITKDLSVICDSKNGIHISDNVFDVRAEDISNVNLIVMNPPFSNAVKHILHLHSIMSDGCELIAIMNKDNFNGHTRQRGISELERIVKEFGEFVDLGSVFENAERETKVDVRMVKIKKPSNNQEDFFDGFFLDDDQEYSEQGIVQYNVVRDLVGRHVEAIKCFDRQMNEAVKMNEIVSGFFALDMGLNITSNQKSITRNEFIRKLKIQSWKWVFDNLNIKKYATQKLKENINLFIEQNSHIPFTMKNIYVMISNIVNTSGDRMNMVIEEVFDNMTKHYSENRYDVEGWKTNEQYLLGKKFIYPCLEPYSKDNLYKIDNNVLIGYRYGNFERIEDLHKAVCFIEGKNYDLIPELQNLLRFKYHIYCNGVPLRGNFEKFKILNSYVYGYGCTNKYDDNEKYLNKLKSDYPQYNFEYKFIDIDYGKWYETEFFMIKCFKKGTIHFEFKDKDVWGRFNQKVAELKGFPLFEKTRNNKNRM